MASPKSTVAYFCKKLTKDHILTVARACPAEPDTRLHLPYRVQRSKELIVQTMLDSSSYWAQALHAKVAEVDHNARIARLEAKSRQVERQKAARQVARSVPDSGNFLDLPSAQESFECYKKFYRATSNKALHKFICGICARSLNSQKYFASRVALSAILNAGRLCPATKHPEQVLTGPLGCLLEREGCNWDWEEMEWIVNICNDCKKDMEDHPSLPPRYSLANDLWIGPIPWVLRQLTIAEQLLIAHVYPRVFVVKLFPQGNIRYALPDDQIQRSMRGNVTSFELNKNDIAKMITGELMPRPTSILASLLSITIIGVKKIPDPSALYIFRVRRNMIRVALLWLKEHNPRYYGDIKIDEARMANLPIDDVPTEILVNIRHDEDASIINAESDGYVPTGDENDPYTTNESSIHTEAGEGLPDDPDVVPLQYLGVHDSDLTGVPVKELINWGLYNIPGCNESSEGAYAVRHGRAVNTFGQARKGDPPRPTDQGNYWEQAFPLLYPHGLGGIEQTRPVKLSLIEQVRWSLAYHDRRFRHHNNFIFVAFGIHQRREALMSVRLQMKRHDFGKTARILATITPGDLEQASREESLKQPISNAAICILKRQIRDVSRRVVGSNASRLKLRSQLWSTSIILGPPTLWMTINPDDLHEPMVQVLAGEQIDMDNFGKTVGPSKVERARNVARDPFAAAEYFNSIITIFLQELFGIVSTGSRIHSTMGVLGRLRGYFGTVECQGRGTLHLHMLLWLHKAPPPRRLKEMLQTEDFREKIVKYLKANVRSYLPQLATQSQLDKIPADSEVAFSRPPNPAMPPDVLQKELTDIEVRVVRTKQMHGCLYRSCLRYDNRAQLVCKRRAPWDLSDIDTVDTNGNCLTKRTLGYMNAYCPAIAVTGRCNQDIKFLTHGRDTLNLIFYVTKYIAKAALRSHNASSLLTEGLYYHYAATPEIKSLHERQRDLIDRSVTILNREHEIPAPLAVSYLMGWGDTYCSHRYTPIYWSAFVSLINQTYPDLDPNFSRVEVQLTQEGIEMNNLNQGEGTDNPELVTHEQLAQANQETILLVFDKTGQLRPRSQIDDYMLRAEQASQYNMLDYFVNTYETQKLRKETPVIPPAEVAQGSSRPSAPGRPAHERIEYLSTHPRHENWVRVIRPPEHNTLPNMIGPYFPRRSDPDQADRHAAWCLTLLKPWRHLTDLKTPEQSWTGAFENFIASSDDRIPDIIDNLDHYRSCEAAAEAKRKESGVVEELDVEDDITPPENPDQTNGRTISSTEITQEMVDEARDRNENRRDAVHGRQAVEIGYSKGIFDSTETPNIHTVNRASNKDLEDLEKWSHLLEKEKQLAIEAHSARAPAAIDINENITPDVVPIQDLQVGPSIEPPLVDPLPAQSITPATVQSLFPDQRRAFDIVHFHLTGYMRSQNHPDALESSQLLMLLVGEGGTGKSKVIQTITEDFTRQGAKHMLLKSAYTGIAASLIDGQTTHHIASIAVGNNNQVLSNEARTKLALLWKDVAYLIVDEFSMLSKQFLARLSRHITIAKLENDSSVGGLPFGGVNVILAGDLHQFPPVAVASHGALYHPTNISRGNGNIDHDAAFGRAIYEKFDTVVTLKKQIRVTDERWQAFLGRLRRGMVTEADIDMLKGLVLTSSSCKRPNFSTGEWKDVVLITPRHSVRTRWNDAAVEQHSRRSGNQLYICPASDTCKGKNGRRPLYPHEQYAAALSNSGSSRGRDERNGLPDKVSLAIGLKVMVTLNIQTDLDVANGARGTITGIILDPNEPPFDPNKRVIKLSRLPAYILVKMDRTRISQLPGLEERVIPIIPVMRTYKIVLSVAQKDGQVKPVSRTVERHQFPITPAYAFTDYRAQGQTIPAVIVDIASPPTGTGLSLANIYVALSRSSGTKTIRLLRDFDESIFMNPLEYDLMREDERQEKLDEKTKKWWEAKIKVP